MGCEEEGHMKGSQNKITALILGIGLAGSAILSAKAPAPDTLQSRVRHELVMLPRLNVFDDLSFRVDGSTVTLFGEVTQPVMKSDAGNVVKRIEGVTRVENQIEVLPLSPMDNQI